MKGTRVLRLAVGEGDSLDLLEPVRSAIGASLISTLMANDFNILAEGASDKPIFEAAFALFQPAVHRRIVTNGSVSETGKLLPTFYERTGLPYVIYLDADSGGRDIRAALASAGIPPGKFVYLGDVIQRQGDFELEDIIDPGLYHQAVQRAYSDKPVEQPPDQEGKRTKRYERSYKDIHNIGFSKRRVAEALKPILLQMNPEDHGIDGLRTLCNRIWDVLQSQVKAKPVAEAAQAEHG
jgi:hypothetical protein